MQADKQGKRGHWLPVVVMLIVAGPTPGRGVAGLILACFTMIGGWIALSPVSRGCRIGVNDGAGTPASGLACRVPFGIGALITGGMTVYAGIAWLRARRHDA